jgi:hypothetical protein
MNEYNQNPRRHTRLLAAAIACATMAGCVIKFGPLDEDYADKGGGEETTQGDPQAPEQTPEEQAEEALAQVDSEQLALAEAKAALTTAYLVAEVESLGQDPSTLDETALEQLMQQYLPAASASADAWLATLDLSALSTTNFVTRAECHYDHGCLYLTKCKYNPPAVVHNCWVTDCGKSRCSICPDWIADLLKSLVLTSWCAYVCTENGKSNVVAIGAGGISAFKGYFVGPICKEP